MLQTACILIVIYSNDIFVESLIYIFIGSVFFSFHVYKIQARKKTSRESIWFKHILKLQ